MSNKYQHLFSNRIWQRGLEYYYDNRVISINKNRDKVYATVEGNGDEYRVVIGLRNGKVVFMECDCPYAMDGNNCKHEAAVISEMEDKGYLSSTPNRTKAFNEWKNIVQQYPRNLLSFETYRRKFDESFGKHLLSKQEELMNNTTREKALSSISQAFIQLNEINVSMKYTQTALHMLIKQLEASNDIKIQKWAEQELTKVKQSYIIQELIKLIAGNNQEGLIKIDKYIGKYKKEKNAQIVSSLLKQRISIMEVLNYTDYDIHQYLQPFSNYEVAIDYEINYLINHHNYSKAINKIQNILNMPSLVYRKKRELEDLMAEIYFKIGDNKKYMEYIVTLPTNISIENLISYGKKLVSMFKEKIEAKKALIQLSEQIKNKETFDRHKVYPLSRTIKKKPV